MTLRTGLIVLLTCFYLQATSQALIQQQVYVKEQSALWHPLCGGLNNPQFSAGDLNNDGIEDLFVFDKEGDVILTFENGGTPNTIDYTFNPELEVNFPDSIRHWAMLRDYNLDGIMDIFCYSTVPGIGGMSVYKGSYGSDNIIQFSLEVDYLKHPSFQGPLINVYISNEDFPAVDDVDNDGDMDVLTFSILGGYIEYYENQSAELGYGSDSLIFKLVDECWGRAYESGIVNALELTPRMDSCPYRESFIGQKGFHIGSNLMTLDIDNDQDKELFLGDISFSDIIFAKNNGGNPDTAWFVDQETGFPSYDVPADIHLFPAMFSLDVDNDGMKDFISSPQAGNISVDVDVAWYYRNVTDNLNPMYTYVKKDFVVAGMIDVGDETNPTFFDHNSDGLMDLIVSGYGRWNKVSGVHDASIYLYENIGTSMCPRYQLINQDYGGMFALGINGLHTAFGDFDGDGDDDMVVGNDVGDLYYLENMDTGNGIASYPTITPAWQSIDVGQRSAPTVIDLNQDGLQDLVIGERNGLINYYENQGTASSPTLTLVNDSLGIMDPRSSGFPTGYGAVTFEEDGSDLYCYLGTAGGEIRKYLVDLDSINSGTFQLVDPDFGGLREGERTRLAIADINADGINDYMVGNRRGGVSLFSTAVFGCLTPNNEDIIETTVEFSIWPNPTNEILNIGIENSNNKQLNLRIFNALGQELMSSGIEGSKQLNVSKFAAGVYFVELSEENSMIGTQKFIKE